MITIRFTDEEAVILSNIVVSFLEDLHAEIMYTDRHSREYREMLEQEEKIVKKILEELQAKAVKATAL